MRSTSSITAKIEMKLEKSNFPATEQMPVGPTISTVYRQYLSPIAGMEGRTVSVEDACKHTSLRMASNQRENFRYCLMLGVLGLPSLLLEKL
ncbi:hypothetical protein L6452_03025 [Arctium lappa]|uniref:Uncharacterized protein n=1 Tax=Arctium lappa TaxID=4217 RepID=A0ACB9FKQ3_ARCLA|nr:hypothetical protein L6452_03025 [Arctium lappa]